MSGPPSKRRVWRREIAALERPFMAHEHFPATKLGCSSSDGLTKARKSSVAKVTQELKRGRAHVDQQLAQLDAQLLAISDFLDGKSATMFPPHMIHLVEDNPDPAATPQLGSTANADGRIRRAGMPAGKGGAGGSDASSPVTPAVEDDLASDTPCSTTGLWKYLCAYSFFKTVTPEDMERALQLEDPWNLSADLTLPEADRRGDDDVLGFTREGSFRLDDALCKQEARSTKSSRPELLPAMDDFFKERLVASLCPATPSARQETLEDDTASSSPSLPLLHPEDKNGEARRTDLEESDQLSSFADVNLRSWSPSGLTDVLRDVGLLEMPDKEVVQRCLASPEDDEVCQEIRVLQRELRTQVERTNEIKRKLRKQLDEKKPWLSTKKATDDATVKRYLDLWHKKKETERKKKLREKKRQRRQALRLGGGGGNGKALVNAKDAR